MGNSWEEVSILITWVSGLRWRHQQEKVKVMVRLRRQSDVGLSHQFFKGIRRHNLTISSWTVVLADYRKLSGISFFKREASHLRAQLSWLSLCWFIYEKINYRKGEVSERLNWKSPNSLSRNTNEEIDRTPSPSVLTKKVLVPGHGFRESARFHRDE